jgi:hypothetical protein
VCYVHGIKKLYGISSTQSELTINMRLWRGIVNI